MIFCFYLPNHICFAEDSVFEYTLEGDKAIITGLNPNSERPEDLVIPSTIDGYTVVGIADEAFSRKYFNSITIPDTIKRIGYMAFYATYVNYGQVIHIPKSVEDILPYAFSYMRGVIAFEVDPENQYFTSEDGVLFTAGKKVLLNYPLGKQDETYFVPEETTLLYCTCFGNCTNLKNLVLQNNEVKRMGYTFFGCDLTLYGGPDCYERLWMDELTDKYKYCKVRYGGIYVPAISLIEEDSSVNRHSAISVIVNGKKLSFDQNPIIYNSRVLVPLRGIFEELGATVTWDGSTKTITAKKGDITISLEIDSAVIMVNNERYIFDVPAKLINGRTLVPVRAVAEAFGAYVNWDNNTSTVNIKTANNTTKELSLSLSNGKTVTIGWNIDELTEELLWPNRIEISTFGLEWYVYNNDYNNFVMVAVYAGKVCGFYTNSKGFSLNNGIYYGCSSDININPSKNVQIEYFFDKYSNNTLYAVLVLPGDRNYLDDPIYTAETIPKEFFHVQSLDNFDATNAFRANYGLKPLLWEEYAAVAAADHSQDMADKNYFSHISPDGRSALDRYLEINNVPWELYGENISAGRAYGIDIFDGWINSEGHRKNILNDEFKYLGVGGGFNPDSKHLFYMTQLFVTY